MKEPIDILRKKGLILTPQRLAVLSFLKNSLRHPTAEEVYGGLKRRFPTMSRATVYTTLKVLRGVGEIQELSIRGDKSCFDGNSRPHHHFLCRQCDRVYDLDIVCPYTHHGWVEGHKIEDIQGYFYGICRECLKREKEGKTDHSRKETGDGRNSRGKKRFARSGQGSSRL